MEFPQLSIDVVLRLVQFAMWEYKELPCRAYKWLKKLLTHTFELDLPFPTVHKMKVVLIAARRQTNSTSKCILGTRQNSSQISCPIPFSLKLKRGASF